MLIKKKITVISNVKKITEIIIIINCLWMILDMNSAGNYGALYDLTYIVCTDVPAMRRYRSRSARERTRSTRRRSRKRYRRLMSSRRKSALWTRCRKSYPTMSSPRIPACLMKSQVGPLASRKRRETSARDFSSLSYVSIFFYFLRQWNRLLN